MTIDVKYGQLQAQTESAKSACQQLKNALPSLQHAIMQITMQNHLKGQSIQSAKQYVQQLAMPVLLAAEETIDYFETGIEKFTSEYFDKKDWCDEDLKEKIDQLKKQRTANKQMLTAMKKASTKGMSAKAKASRKDVMSSLSKANGTLSEQIEKYEAILRKLEDYDEQSTQFLSEFSSLYQKVSTGIHQASISYDPGRQLFNLPSTKDLSWKQSFKSIEHYQKDINRLNHLLNQSSLSKKETIELINLGGKYPNVMDEISKKTSVKTFIKSYLNHLNSGSQDYINESTLNLLAQSLGISLQHTGHHFQTKMKGPKGANSFVIIDPYSSSRPLVTKGFSVGDYLGKGITAWTLWQGYQEDRHNNMTVGEAISHTGFIYLMGEAGTYMVNNIIDMIKKDAFKGHIGWKIIVKDIAIGGTAGFLGSTLGQTFYDTNFLYARDIVDATSFIGDSIDMTKREIYKAWKEVKPHWFEFYKKSEVEKMKNYGQALTLR